MDHNTCNFLPDAESYINIFPSMYQQQQQLCDDDGATTSNLVSHRTCNACKRLLPEHSFHKSLRYKYWRCKDCEKVRLRKYRLDKKQERIKLKENAHNLQHTACPKCLQMVPLHKLANTGKYRYVYCITCDNRRRRKVVSVDLDSSSENRSCFS